ncbi:MAG: OmpH family outer membrane protein [Tepidisphaeraceae bacterium]|jgi:Skp family chaperone for outer membrane proteins
MKSIAKSPLSLVGLFVAGMLLLAAAPVRADDTSPKIAFCSTGKVLTSLQEFKDLSDKAKQDEAQLQKDQVTKKADVDQMQSQLSLLVPDSPEYAAKSQEVLKAEIEYDSWLKLSEANLQTTLNAQTRALFEKMQTTIKTISAARGFDLVLASNEPNLDQIDLSTVNNNQLSGLLLQVQVLFGDPKLDITQDVINQMDKDYAAKSK